MPPHHLHAFFIGLPLKKLLQSSDLSQFSSRSRPLYCPIMASAAVIKGSSSGGGGGGGSGLKVKPRPANDVKGKAVAVSEVKKTKSVTVVSKPEVKGKSVTTTVTTSTSGKSTSVRVKTVKKVYTLPGQKHDPPEEREPLRIFYQSLSEQIPSSEMAEIWLMEHGMLSPDRAKKAYERKQRKQRGTTGTTTKSTKQERPESSNKPQLVKNGDSKAKKRAQYSDDEDDEFIMKNKRIK